MFTVCEATFKTRNDCKAHRIKHFREKNPIAQGFGRGKRFPDGEQYKCNYCDRIFEVKERNYRKFPNIDRDLH